LWVVNCAAIDADDLVTPITPSDLRGAYVPSYPYVAFFCCNWDHLPSYLAAIKLTYTVPQIRGGWGRKDNSLIMLEAKTDIRTAQSKPMNDAITMKELASG
jgi:hypothetical protein